MKRIVVSLLFFAFSFNSCNSIPEVGIKSLGFGEEIETLQNLFIEFDEELVFDGDLNQWESTPYLNFEPKIEGKFKWIGKKELVFSPAKPMKFATKYIAKPSDHLLKRKKGKLNIEKELKINFHTPYLKVKEASVFQIRNQNQQKETRLILELNGKYDTQNIKDEIKISQKNQELEYEIKPSTSSNNLVLAIKNAYEKQELKINIIGKENQAAHFAKSQSLEIEYLPNEKLQILQVSTSFKKLKGYINVKTNQQINTSQIEKNIKIEPEVRFSIESSDQGFVIKGDFNQDDLYKLILNKNIIGALGGKLDDDYETEVYFGRVNPYLEFTNKNAQYISTKGNKNIGVNIVNIPKVSITVSKIYENNLLPFLKGNRRSYYEGESEEYYYQNEASLYADQLTQKKVETADLPIKQGVSVLNLPLPEQTDKKGVFFVSVDSEDEYYRKIQKIVSVSDLGIITKVSQNGQDISVFVNSIMTTEAQKGVEVKLISNSNQEIIKGITNNDGYFTFKDLKKKYPQYQAAMVTVNNGEDFNYLLFEDTQIETSKFNLEGKAISESGLDAFIYGDREIYRPGETIHFNAVVRDSKWNTAKEIPVKIKVKQPNGKEILSQLTKTSLSGSIAYSLPLERAALTGFYNIDVLTGNDLLIGSKSISVEDFMPDRIKVKLEAPLNVKVGQKPKVQLYAQNLFGPPASDNKYEMEFSVKRKLFQPKGYESYSFGLDDNSQYESEVRTGITDTKGYSEQTFDIKEEWSGKGLLEAKVLASVFDETGRPVHRQTNFDVFTQDQFIGIKLAGYFAGTNASFPIDLVSLNPQGTPVAANVDLEIVLLDYQTVLEKTENGLRYVSKKKEKLIKTQNVQLGTKPQTINFIPKISGEYEIKARLNGGNNYVSQTFYAYGFGNKASFEVDTDGEVTIESDKESYNIGETAKLIFKTPFDGKLLITIENEGILTQKYQNTTNKSADFSFQILTEQLPNIIVTATLVRSMNQPELPLMSAHGMKSLKVDETKRRIPIVINAIEKSRSKTKQKVEVRTRPNTELTIAVVDEGILQLKNTETPDIFGFFYQKRASLVNAYDLYPLLLPEIQLNNVSKTGGDGGLGKRINPLANGRAELVSYWSGILKSDANGKASFEFDIPEFLGSLRIMVVAYDEENFGSQDQTLTVSDPISISAGLPLFLSPGDKIKVPVSIFNTTEKLQNVKVSASTEGQIEVTVPQAASLSIQGNKDQFIELEAKAKNQIGLGKLKIVAKTDQETFTRTIEISIRPAGSLQKSGSSGLITKEQELAFTQPVGYLPGTFSSKVFISNKPMMQFGYRLENLLEYPHGCIEQTISKAFVQLYFDDLALEINGDSEISETGQSELNPQQNVAAAIEKIQNIQLYNGALPYWQGQTDEDWWGSAYACHFLLEAKKAGFDVNPTQIQSLIYYLTNKTNEPQQNELFWVRQTNNSVLQKERLQNELIYSLYVLSLTDDPNLAGMNLLKADLNKLSNDQRYLLACAYKQIGDDASFGQLLPKTFVRESYDRMLSGSFASPIRSMALVLNTLLETDQTNVQIAGISQTLNGILSNRNNLLNTQELAFSLMEMGKSLKGKTSEAKAELYADGKLIRTIEGKGQWVDLSKYTGGIKIKASGDYLYYYLESEGIRKDNIFKPEDKSLKVRKAYFTRTGTPITNNTFKQNQLVVVRLTVNTASDFAYKIDNVVLTDMLPAGLEIENPRLVEDRDMAWIKNASSPQYFDIRDDRINYFVNTDQNEKHYYYLARAVTRGTFIQGPVSADAMYNANLRSYWGGGSVTVN
jgi:uncharacterized protein YfaS (alpha-2-macroglobulin family)